MKIAIPLVNGKLSMHFGHCQEFALFSVNEQNKQIIQQENLIPPPHEPGLLPRWLAEHQVNLIIAGGMGQRAQEIFNQNGISVVVGAAADDPKTIINAYLNHTLQTGANTCDH
jgi:predicted Fe-Mo cluster-binding NifX family protein